MLCQIKFYYLHINIFLIFYSQFVAASHVVYQNSWLSYWACDASQFYFIMFISSFTALCMYCISRYGLIHNVDHIFLVIHLISFYHWSDSFNYIISRAYYNALSFNNLNVLLSIFFSYMNFYSLLWKNSNKSKTWKSEVAKFTEE